MSRFGRIVLQMFAVSLLYLVLSYFNLVSWYLILGIVLLVGVYLYFQVRITDNELYFEVVCNTRLYLQKLERSKEAKQDSDVYHLGLAYAALYQGDYDTVEHELNRVDITRITTPKRHRPIYIRIRARLAFEQKDLDTVHLFLEQAKELEQDQLVGYITSLQLYLQEQYDDLVIILKDTIAKEVTRLHIIELEYLLALAFEQLGQTESALAIYAFIVKKGYGVKYNDWAYDKYIEIKDNEEEKSISQEN